MFKVFLNSKTRVVGIPDPRSPLESESGASIHLETRKYHITHILHIAFPGCILSTQEMTVHLFRDTGGGGVVLSNGISKNKHEWLWAWSARPFFATLKARQLIAH